MSNRVAMPRYRHIPQREIDMTIIADGNSSVAATVSPHEMETRNSKRRRSTGEVVNENSNFSEQDSEYENIPNTKLSENNGDHNTNHAAEQEEENEMTDPDWESIVLHEPARTDVPIFLNARDRRDASDLRFGQALDELHETLNASVKGILDTMAEIHEATSIKLNAMEDELKENFEMNEKSRAMMAQKLQESAAAAQGLFANLLMKVEQGVVKGKK